MGRPRQFDEAQALDRALQTFWARGFEATSLDDLCQAMEIGRSSLYQAFGSKHNLLIAALDRYDATAVARIEAVLSAPRPIRESIALLLDGMVEESVGTAGGRGCFMGNCAAELARRDPAVADRLRRSLGLIEGALRDGLARARDAGEFAPDYDVTRTARFLTGTIQGLRLIAKTRPERAVLDDIVVTALKCLD